MSRVIGVDLLLIFAAGLASFLSPCVLPLAPPYLIYLAGLEAKSLEAKSLEAKSVAEGGGAAARRRGSLLVAATAFTAGFSTVFIALGLSAFALGRFFLRHMETLSILAGGVVIAWGLHFLGVMRFSFFDREARFRSSRRPTGLLGVYAMGLAFGFGWTPCIGPVLGTILALAATAETAMRGALLLSIYALGLGTPFLAAAASMERFTAVASRFRRHARAIERVTGAALIAVGFAFLSGWTQRAAFLLLETFPSLGRLG